MSTIEIKVPDIGDFTDVPVINILVSPGDHVAAEDALIELESDKATMEVPSPQVGDVKEILIKEGDKVSEGTPIIVLEVGEAKAPVAPPNPKGHQEHEPEPPKPAPAPAEAKSAPAPAKANGAAPAAVETSGKPHASPSVRAFARELGVDLGRVQGSGRKGRILREDVTAYYKGQVEAAAPKAAPAAEAKGGMGIPPIPKVDFSKFGSTEDVEMSRIKKISGPALHRSWLNIPHVTHQEEADITALDAYRKELDTAAKAEGYRVTLLSFVIKACVSALK
ncbi:MAG: biotin/lipoyl-containing protein, partial [Pseudomonadota bacterium]